jgi:hypothetical protein
MSRKYHAYLKSDAWFLKRKKVMLRSGGICEGCRCADATQVHHLTYDNIFNELLFQLVALCDKCHARAHNK